MKFLIPAVLLTFFSHSLYAGPKHRSHGAHQHGTGELSVAFEGGQGKVELQSPSDSIVGFEHMAKSEADLKTRDEAFKKLETHMAEMISFDKSLQCRFSKDKIEMQAESARHSNTVVQFSITCARSPLGTQIRFQFQKFFPELRHIKTQILVDQLQKSFEITSKDASWDLK